ncbi:ISNCY family transposase [Pantoea agglomerans]|uniref:ISNCY family transposase n=1 Tax=Enterobacter agglomerans TaxID=549 RepID=UPI003C7BD50D
MTADGLWIPQARRQPRVYQPRQRRDCPGKLIQIDGSHHDWFEGRAPKCCLLVYIDDATSRLMHLRFCQSESAFDYMVATRDYIDKHGKPVAFYSDKHTVFRVSQAETRRTGVTQFGRALHDLNIELICANSSQAKGRVERANLTLQDRLVKEMRLENISGIDNANAWLETFISDFNRRFGRPATYPKNLHRPVSETRAELDNIFAWQTLRTLSTSLRFSTIKCFIWLSLRKKTRALLAKKSSLSITRMARLHFATVPGGADAEYKSPQHAAFGEAVPPQLGGQVRGAERVHGPSGICVFSHQSHCFFP